MFAAVGPAILRAPAKPGIRIKAMGDNGQNVQIMQHYDERDQSIRPVSLVKLALVSIPKSLKKLDRWIVWKYVWRKTKWTKPPHSAVTGKPTDATDLSNGVSFVTAVQFLRAHGDEYDGLGFLLGEGYAGIDVDDCLDEKGDLDARGQAISDQYAATYAEVSPSGTGFKILVDISSDPKLAVISGKNTGDMEIYAKDRYFTVTGNILPGHAASVVPMAEAFSATAAQMGIDVDGRHLALVDTPIAQSTNVLGIDMPAARELLDHLPFKWCEIYHEWLKAGMALHHEFSGSPDALALWDEWSQRSTSNYDPEACRDKWRTFGRPGKTFVTVRTLVREAEQSGWRSPQTIARAMHDFTAFDEPAELVIDEDGVYSEAPNWWHKYSIGNMLRTEAPLKQWIWRGVLMVGKLMVLAGSGGSSKSYLMLGAAVQYALNTTWGPFEACGEPDDRVLLLYGEEDADDVHNRVRALRHSFMLDDEQIATIEQRVAILPLRGSNVELAKLDRATDNIVVTEQLRRLEARITEYKVRLVILDPLAMFHGLEENNNVVIASLVRELDAVCMRCNCAMVIVHHFGKSGNVTAREVNETHMRGASALAAHARTVAVMHRLQADEATSWGVQEEDHNRWVMWKIVKTNYGPNGLTHWFEVDERSGAIRPSPTQLTYLNTRDIREVARANAEQQQTDELTAVEERRGRLQAQAEVTHWALVRFFVEYSHQRHTLPGMRKAGEVAHTAGIPCSASQASKAIQWIKDQMFVDTDGFLNEAGRNWLESANSI